MAPGNIAEMCCFDSERYQLRSAARAELVVPLAKKVTLGRRGFTNIDPFLLIALPRDIRDSCLSFYQFRN